VLLQQEITKAIQTAAKQLIDDMGLVQIETLLLESPARIKAKQDQAIEKQREIDGLKKSAEEPRNNLESIKAVTEAEVITETNGDNKPRFSNDKLRSAEVTRRLAASEEYQEARREVQGFEEQIATIGLDVSMIRNEIGQLESTMGNYRAILNSRSAQITAIFGGQV